MLVSVCCLFLQGIKLKGSAIELLEAMLEETNRSTGELAKEIAGGLDVGALHDTLCDFHALMQDRDVQRAQFDDDAEKGMFRTYHILVHLSHYGVPASDLGERGVPNVRTVMYQHCVCLVYVRSCTSIVCA